MSTVDDQLSLRMPKRKLGGGHSSPPKRKKKKGLVSRSTLYRRTKVALEASCADTSNESDAADPESDAIATDNDAHSNALNGNTRVTCPDQMLNMLAIINFLDEGNANGSTSCVESDCEVPAMDEEDAPSPSSTDSDSESSTNHSAGNYFFILGCNFSLILNLFFSSCIYRLGDLYDKSHVGKFNW